MTAPLHDLIAIRDLDRSQVDDLLDTARDLLPIARRERASVPTLRGRIVCNLFLEDSTRTRRAYRALMEFTRPPEGDMTQTRLEPPHT